MSNFKLFIYTFLFIMLLFLAKIIDENYPKLNSKNNLNLTQQTPTKINSFLLNDTELNSHDSIKFMLNLYLLKNK